MRILNPSIAKDKQWIDFSSAKNFMACPRQYWWSSIQNVQHDVEKTALINGEACHATKAKFYELKRDYPNMEWEYVKAESLKAGEPIIRSIKEPTDYHNLSKFSEVMTIYMETHRFDTDESLMIEVAGAIDMGEFLFAFRLDRLSNSQSLGVIVEETKTTTILGNKWNRRGKPNMQIDGYIIGIEALTEYSVDGACLDVIPFHAKTSRSGFRIYTKRSFEDREVWYHDIRQIWDEIARCKENNFFRRNTETCVPLLSYECPYTVLCEMYPNPHIIEELYLPSEYKIQKWEPFEGLEI